MRGVLVVKLLIVIAAIFLFAQQIEALERCKRYVQQERVQHTRYFGNGFPWWYGVGQIQQESACRADAVAFDGGAGLSQFMPVTERDMERQLREQFNPYNPAHAIRMQAFYMSRIHSRNKTKKLFLDFQSYNGGEGNIAKDLRNAGIAEWQAMRVVCQRKVLILKNGRSLDLCDVNYDYSKRVWKYGQLYKTGVDTMVYW